MPPSTSFTLTVRYAETDAQGIVHHSVYLVWFEEGRSDFLRQRGLPYSDLEQSGYCIVVAEAEVKYRAPSCYEDRLTVTTTLERARGKVLEFRYRAEKEDGTLVAEGRTVHVVLGPDRRPMPLPDEILQRFL